MKNLKYLLALFLFTIISCVDDNVMKPEELVTSEIQLNEIFTTGPDWIELYNSGTTAVDLTGYALADSGTKWPVPSGIVPADGFVTYDCDGLDTNGSTNFKISAGGESVYLYNQNDILVDEVATPDLSITPDDSYSREVDGGDDWVVTAATKGTSNNDALSKIKVKINEIKASGSPDWLELYNGGSQEIDLTGYSLADSGSSWIIPNMVIASGGYVVINCDGLDTNGSTNFKISKGGEQITLTNSEGTIIDQIDLPDLSAYKERSYGRVSDGSDTWVVMDDSKEAANGTIYEYLTLQASYAIDVPEPSGLAYLNDELFTVSDQTLKVYKMSLTGEVLDTLAFVGNDLEGVSTYTEGKLLLAEEVKKEVVELNITDGTAITHAIEYENNTPNSGMEGVTYNSKDKTTYILNEKDPGKLIHLAEDFSIIDTYNLLFAQDYSGIFYDASIDALWIVSDQSKTVNKCNLKGEVIKSYSIDFVKSEGVVIANDKIYIVSDSEEKLYIFDKPDN